jgi:hypothetical protein
MTKIQKSTKNAHTVSLASLDNVKWRPKLEELMNRNVRELKITIFAMIAILALTAPTWADDGPAHRIDQVFPVKLGTSGGNINDRSKAFCYGGTLGALVQDGEGVQYILSNNHVLARTNLAATGEDIIQPGLIDQDPVCTQDSGDGVADLSAFITIHFKAKNVMPTNNVDAAIAEVRPGAVISTGEIIDIGTISNATLDPALGLAVKKSGRTSGLTKGTISAVNVTVDISYGSGKTARFINQVLITPGSFLAGGDSGSLMVEDVDTTPQSVGLLFAGSSSVAIANPIGTVLSAFGVTMVGTDPLTSLTDRIRTWAKNLFRISESHAASAQLPPQVNPAAVDAVRRVKERHEARLLSTPGVVGVGVGRSEKVIGQAAIEIYVKQATSSLRQVLPNSLDGVEVKIVETGEIHAY